MNSELKITKDGSHTLYVPALDEQYHSMFGAINESMHIFINYGFNQLNKNRISVFEAGFGTGLNAYLTAIESSKRKCNVYYQSIELYPIQEEYIKKLNYPEQINPDTRHLFEQIHAAPWEKEIAVSENFTICKNKIDIVKFNTTTVFDIIYFDAFAPNKQPELWTEEVFKNMYSMLVNGGLLLTYSCKGTVKRALAKNGFTINKKPGPIGKREIIQAIKNA